MKFDNKKLETAVVSRVDSPGERRDRIKALGDMSEAVLQELSDAVVEEDWVRFDAYLLAAEQMPSATMTPLLCDVLRRQEQTVPNEHIVEVLEEIADPESLDCLKDTLLWEPEWDDAHGIAIKCTWAIAQVGGTRAKAILEDAASTGPSDVRFWAKSMLQSGNFSDS